MHTPHTALGTTLPYAHTLTYGLLQYAARNPSFAEWLAATLAHLEPTVHHTYEACAAMPCLVPQNEQTAMRRTYWLLDTCTQQRAAGHLGALAILSSWAHIREREDPKAFVLGFDVGWWPIGVMGRQKKRRHPMDIIVREDVARTSSIKFTRSLTALTHRVVEKGLIMANGHTGKLEPELGDWLFGDKDLALFSASQHTLHQLQKDIAATGAPYAHERDTVGINMLALSPALFFDLPNSDDVQSLGE